MDDATYNTRMQAENELYKYAIARMEYMHRHGDCKGWREMEKCLIEFESQKLGGKTPDISLVIGVVENNLFK